MESVVMEGDGKCCNGEPYDGVQWKVMESATIENVAMENNGWKMMENNIMESKIVISYNDAIMEKGLDEMGYKAKRWKNKFYKCGH